MLLQVLTTLQTQVAEQRAIADEAIRTKAMIGDKKVATAMATASVAVRKATRLEIELDRSQEYRTIKGMETRHKGFKFDWRLLKKASQQLNVAIIPVFDASALPIFLVGLFSIKKWSINSTNSTLLAIYQAPFYFSSS